MDLRDAAVVRRSARARQVAKVVLAACVVIGALAVTAEPAAANHTVTWGAGTDCASASRTARTTVNTPVRFVACAAISGDPIPGHRFEVRVEGPSRTVTSEVFTDDFGIARFSVQPTSAGDTTVTLCDADGCLYGTTVITATPAATTTAAPTTTGAATTATTRATPTTAAPVTTAPAPVIVTTIPETTTTTESPAATAAPEDEEEGADEDDSSIPLPLILLLLAIALLAGLGIGWLVARGRRPTPPDSIVAAMVPDEPPPPPPPPPPGGLLVPCGGPRAGPNCSFILAGIRDAVIATMQGSTYAESWPVDGQRVYAEWRSGAMFGDIAGLSPVRMSYQQHRPSSVEITKLSEEEDGAFFPARAVQKLFYRFDVLDETGAIKRTFVNLEPMVMAGDIESVPPFESTFIIQNDVPFYDLSSGEPVEVIRLQAGSPGLMTRQDELALTVTDMEVNAELGTFRARVSIGNGGTSHERVNWWATGLNGAQVLTKSDGYQVPFSGLTNLVVAGVFDREAPRAALALHAVSPAEGRFGEAHTVRYLLQTDSG